AGTGARLDRCAFRKVQRGGRSEACMASPVVTKDIGNDLARFGRGQAPGLYGVPRSEFWNPDLSASGNASVGTGELEQTHRSIPQNETRAECVEGCREI